MHVPDGLIATNQPTSVAIAVGMWIVSTAFLAWSWKKAKATYSRSITALLAVFIPLASSSPDGLERVVQNFGVAKHTPTWNGIMSDYAIAAIGNPYVSTLLAGVFGILMVLLAGFLLGKAMAPKKPKAPE